MNEIDDVKKGKGSGAHLYVLDVARDGGGGLTVMNLMNGDRACREARRPTICYRLLQLILGRHRNPELRRRPVGQN
jgi:hypothetical protein